jgi:hypothetical protein
LAGGSLFVIWLAISFSIIIIPLPLVESIPVLLSVISKPITITASNARVARAVVQLVQPEKKLNLDGGHVDADKLEAPPDCTRAAPREREFIRGIPAYRYLLLG